MATLFDISEQNLSDSFYRLEAMLGRPMLLEWRRILLTAASALRGLVPAESETSEPDAQQAETSPSPKESPQE